mmetsp:Transcript_19756/g.27586  ORF Transcript_19756/g.27586 Transcript_19756/m.27586 type:complete len:84 (-) Transcript_19756:326-577(-)
MGQPAMIVLNPNFEIIYFWKKDCDSPLGRPYPSSLFPVIIKKANQAKSGETLSKIPEEETVSVATQGASSIPGVLGRAICAIV